MTNRIEQDDCVYMLDFIFKFVGMLNGVTIKYFVSQLDLHHFHSQFACSSGVFSCAQIRIDLCMRKYIQFKKRLCVNINVEYVCHIPLNFYYDSKQSKLVILILGVYTDIFFAFCWCCCYRSSAAVVVHSSGNLVHSISIVEGRLSLEVVGEFAQHS